MCLIHITEGYQSFLVTPYIAGFAAIFVNFFTF